MDICLWVDLNEPIILMIGQERVVIKPLEVRKHQVRLGLKAPPEVRIMRKEKLDEQQTNRT